MSSIKVKPFWLLPDSAQVMVIGLDIGWAIVGPKDFHRQGTCDERHQSLDRRMDSEMNGWARLMDGVTTTADPPMIGVSHALDGDAAVRNSRGFTLIELMVVIAIIGIIAAIAIPAFNEQMRKSRRSEALGGLGDIASKQELWRSNHAQYADNGAVTAPPSTIQVNTANFYTLDVTVNNATRWTATATPRGAQTGDRCGTYTFDVDNVARPGAPPLKTAAQTDCF